MSIYSQIKSKLLKESNKAGNYFGVGQPGFGSFGNQVINPIRNATTNPLVKSIKSNVVRPTQQYFAPSPQLRARDIVREMPNSAYQVGKNILQDTARSLAAGGGTISNMFGDKRTSITPSTRFEKALFGNEPVRTLKGAIEYNAPKVQQQTGLNSTLSKGIAGLGFIGAVGSNFIPSGGGSISKITKLRTAEEILPELQKLKSLRLLENKLPGLAAELKATTTEKETANIINNFIGKNSNSMLIKTEPKAQPQQLNWPIDRPIPPKEKRIYPTEFMGYKDKAGQTVITQQEAENMLNGAIYRATDKNQKKGFYQLFDKWVAEKEIGKTIGAEKAYQLNVPAGQAKSVITNIENNLASGKYERNIKSAYDDLFKEAETLGKQTGQKVFYRRGYITHLWKDSEKEIADKFAKLGRKFSYLNERTIPTYEEGIAMGLKPRYSNPASMVGEYVQKIENTKANLNFFNSMRDGGYIVPASVGRRHPEFQQITAPGWPDNTTQLNDGTIIGGWYAPREIANQINMVFSPQEAGTIGKVLSTGAKLSGGAQDLLLSGGVPKTPLNAWTIAQITKEVLGGRLKSPLMSIVTSLDGKSSQRFFARNASTIKKMQSRNIPFRSEFNIDQVVDKGIIRNIFGESKGEVWNKIVNQPTFARFAPMLQINLFNDIEKAALRIGKNKEEAIDIASKAVSNFYGSGSSGRSARSAQINKDFWSTFFFAPRYRESMINFWINSFKALKNPLALENRSNATFLAGAIATYFAMDQLNMRFNEGKHMSENPDGKKDKLLIQFGDKTIGIPFLSSIATIPRMVGNVVTDVYNGNIKAAGKELKSNVSMLLRPGLDVLSNENYFGSQIYDNNDSLGGKVKASANYLLNPVTGAYTHPYLREGVKLAQGKQGVAETLAKASEMPIRWYDTKSVKNAPFWSEYDNQKKIEEIKTSAKYNRISQETANKQIAKLQSKNPIPVGTMIEGDGYVAYKTSKGINFADTKPQAQVIIWKDQFKSSGKKYGLINIDGEETLLYKNKNGDVLSKPYANAIKKAKTATKTTKTKVAKIKKLKVLKMPKFAKSPTMKLKKISSSGYKNVRVKSSIKSNSAKPKFA